LEEAILLYAGNDSSMWGCNPRVLCRAQHLEKLEVVPAWAEQRDDPANALPSLGIEVTEIERDPNGELLGRPMCRTI
jgi:hypothetical protein